MKDFQPFIDQKCYEITEMFLNEAKCKLFILGGRFLKTTADFDHDYTSDLLTSPSLLEMTEKLQRLKSLQGKSRKGLSDFFHTFPSFTLITRKKRASFLKPVMRITKGC